MYMLSDSICELWKVQGMEKRKKQAHVAKYLNEQEGLPYLWKGKPFPGGKIDDFLEALPNINRDGDIIVHWALNDLYRKRSKKAQILDLDVLDDVFFRKIRLLADKIKEFKRGLVVCGGNAECWGLDSQFDIGGRAGPTRAAEPGRADVQRRPFLHASATIPESR